MRKQPNEANVVVQSVEHSEMWTSNVDFIWSTHGIDISDRVQSKGFYRASHTSQLTILYQSYTLFHHTFYTFVRLSLTTPQ